MQISGCQISSSKNSTGDDGAKEIGLFDGHRKWKWYLEKQLFFNHLFCLADETLLQCMYFLYQLKGTGVTGLFKGRKIKQLSAALLPGPEHQGPYRIIGLLKFIAKL